LRLRPDHRRGRGSSPQPALYHWNDDGGPGAVQVRINLSGQRAYFKRGDRPIGWSYVATGKEGHNTPAGNYRVTEKIVDKKSNRYGWIENEVGDTIDHDASPGDPVPSGARYVAAPMPYWMRLTGYGIGMHAGNIPTPGVPASHGCIRFPKPLAPILFDAVAVGTPVKIEYGPADDPWVVHPQPLPAPESPPKPLVASRPAPPPVPKARLSLRDWWTSKSSPDPEPPPVPKARSSFRDWWTSKSSPAPEPPPAPKARPKNPKGLRVVSPDDAWIVWPDGHPRAKARN